MYKNRKSRLSTAGKSSDKTSLIDNKENSTGAAKRTASALLTIDENASMKIQKSDSKQRVDVHTDRDNDDPFGSQDAIPASQEPTQRYLSQRSILYRTQSRTQQNRTQQQKIPNTYFELVLIKSGVELDQEVFVLSCDNVTFVNNFRNVVSKHPEFPSNIKTFKTGLVEAMKSESLCLKLLTGCSIQVLGQEAPYQSQDSMIVNFLMISILQADVIEVLLDKIEQTARQSGISTSEVPLLPLMLVQMKYVTLTHGDQIYQRILKIYDVATIRAKSDIVANAEFFIQSNKHDDFIRHFIENTPAIKDLINPLTIQTYTNLCLSINVETTLRKKIINHMKGDCPAKLYPVLMKFLLKSINHDDEDVIKKLIMDLRISLHFRNCQTDRDAMIKTELEVFNCITQGLTRSKKFFDTWLKVIQHVEDSDFRPIDLIILIIMITIKEEKSLYMENVLRRLIKQEQIGLKTLTQTKIELFPVMEKHTNTILQILQDFLREKNHLVMNFAKSAYKVIFSISELCQKKILAKLVELTCDKSGNQITTSALEVLQELNREYTKEVQNWGMALMPMLDRINEMDLKQSRMVMELVCSIAYPTPPLTDYPALQDQLDMLVKKQIINRLDIIKKQGIIGTVQLIDHIARNEDTPSDNMYDLDQTYNTADELPEGRGKLAANYISRIYSSTMYCPESLSLFYDEMASTFSAKSKSRKDNILIDRHLLNWICELVTYYFQNHFVVEETPPCDLGVSLTYQKCINTAADNTCTESELAPIAINIAELALKTSKESSSSMLILTPLFKFMRVLHIIRHDGSLETINAVLGCAIVLPEFFKDDEYVDIFEEYDDVLARKIMDIYYHYANWLRETISSFASQDEPMIRKKVLIRLADLIKLENTIRHVLKNVPVDYAPPTSDFMSIRKPGVPKRAIRPQKKNSKPTGNDVETEDMSILATMNPGNVTVANIRIPHQSKGKSNVLKNHFEGTYGPRETYRQMDHGVMLLLRETLSLNVTISPNDVGSCIGLLEFKFIIHDVVNKLESVTGVKKFTSDQHMQHITCPIDFLNDIIEQFLPKIVANFEKLTEEISKILDSGNRALGNADLFTDDFNHLKVCFGLCIRLLAALVSWSGFDEESNERLLRSALVALMGKENNPAGEVSELASATFQKYFEIEPNVIDIKSAVHLYHLLISIKKLARNDALEKKTRDLCKTFLFRKWYSYDGGMEKGALCNVYLNELLVGFLKNSGFKRIKEIASAVLEETKFLKKKDNVLRSFPNIHRANFPMLFRGLCESLITATTTNTKGSEFGRMESVKMWEKSCEILNILLEIVKSLDIPRNFSLFLRYAHHFIKLFIQDGLKVLEKTIRQDPERVNLLLKNLQTTTRFLHNLCCHSKAIKNTAIVAQIPFLRETIENLVFRVKAVLAANKVGSVFWMGNLKNKDLHGDEILSQTNSLALSNEDEDDLPDDVSIEETVVDEEECREEIAPPPPKRRSLRVRSALLE